VANGWTTGCERCHSASGWSGASFSHSFFPLAGGHAGQQCTDCHTTGQLVSIPSTCVSCHLADYQGAPGHVSQAFSQDCIRCHTIHGWTGANFNHDFFPLVGGHSGLDCTRCHTGGTFTKIPSDCFSCHQDDYQRAPDHATLGFPTDCTGCHTVSAWEPASFTHRFPLRGPHDESCGTCHNAGTTTTFTCLVCHEHSKTRMDDKHKEENGYSYDSQACYRCHPNGRH
jgi:hypothetical protein